MSPIRKLVLATLALFIVVAVLHVIGTRHHLYWRLAWFDVVLHLLGGLAVGMGVVSAAAFHAARRGRWPATAAVLAACMAAALVVGVAWEVWEYLTGMVFVEAGGYVADTVIDLALDLLGGGLAALLLGPLKAEPGTGRVSTVSPGDATGEG